VLVNLYRDGRDGVAWHGDTVRKSLPEAGARMSVTMRHSRPLTAHD